MISQEDKQSAIQDAEDTIVFMQKCIDKAYEEMIYPDEDDVINTFQDCLIFLPILLKIIKEKNHE